MDWSIVVDYATKAFGIIALFVITFMVAKRLKSMLHKMLQKTGRVEETLARFISTVAYWAFVILSILSLLSYFGVQTTSFAAVIGGASLAIGLAFQGTLSNLASGVMLLLFRPFKVGDVIKVSGEVGSVEELGLFSTQLITLDNRAIIIPNSGVFGATIENMSAKEFRRVDVDVTTSGAASLREIQALLKEAAARVPGIVDNAEYSTQIYLLSSDAGSSTWQARVWCDPVAYWDVREGLNTELKLQLDEAGALLLRPFKKGDLVRLGGEIGIVQEMTLFGTRINTPDNRVLSVPNGVIAGSIVENLNGAPLRRIGVCVGTDYGADLREVRKVLEAAALTVKGAVNTEANPNQIFLAELGGSSINWEVRVWGDSFAYWDVWQATTLAVKEHLDAAGIGIPFPQLDVHHDALDSAAASAVVAPAVS